MSGRTGIAITVDTDLETRLPLDTEEALYRIGQEAVHNVVKHANATSAHLALSRGPDEEIQMSISDDGTGFDPTLVSGTKLGLIAMRQRAERLGGQLEISSEPGAGTRVNVTMPVPDPQVVSSVE